jgi:hypothetical protein
MWTFPGSMERCLFLRTRSYLEILIDVSPTLTTQEWRPRNRSLSSQLLVYRELGFARVSRPLHSTTARIYLHFRIRSPSLSMPPSSQPASPTRITEVQRAVHGLTQTSRPDLTQTKHDTYHRRSSIADHDHPCCNWQAVSTQLWAYAHIKSSRTL